MITILSHPINHGYTIARIPRLSRCNGVDVQSMRQLKSLVDKVLVALPYPMQTCEC